LKALRQSRTENAIIYFSCGANAICPWSPIFYREGPASRRADLHANPRGFLMLRPGLFAFAAASAFFGAALYINIVEEPARMAIDSRSSIREWTPSYRRGFVMLAVLAIISAILAYADYARSGDVRWTIGGTLIFASCSLGLFRHGPREHLALFDSAARVSLDNSRAHAGMGSARMGTNGNRPRGLRAYSPGA
jgi:hypothetical protein